MPQRIEFPQEKFNHLMETVYPGLLTPRDKYDGSGFPTLWLYPDEDVIWIGQADVNEPVFGRVDSKYGTYEAMLGVSPYRIVFFKVKEYLMKESKSMCRSFWFEVDFEENIWARGEKRKPKEFVSLKLSRPNFKKGMVSQTINFTYSMAQKNGKEEMQFNGWSTCEMDSIKWFDRQTRKFTWRKAENVYKQIIEAYENRVPVTATELVLLIEGTSALKAYLAETEEVEGRVLQAPVMNLEMETPSIEEFEEPGTEEESPPPFVEEHEEPTIEEEPVPPPVEEHEEPELVEEPGPQSMQEHEKPEIVEEPKPPAPVNVAQGRTCPVCNHILRPGALFCGNCGERFDQTGIVCPHCGEPVEFEWKACPTCGCLLPYLCPGCREEMEAHWKACVYCGYKLTRKS